MKRKAEDEDENEDEGCRLTPTPYSLPTNYFLEQPAVPAATESLGRQLPAAAAASGFSDARNVPIRAYPDP